MNQSSSIATAFPFLLLITTAIIFFTTGFVSSIMLFYGGLICWYASYAFLTSIIYARGSKRIFLPIVQLPLAGAGYFLLTKANFKLILFGFVLEDYQFAYLSLVMGLLMALTTRPDTHEIEYAQSQEL